ncbi:MAG TPA: hypothetical protein VNV25_22070 [Gemmatimonadaceae bacterium]|nr:hypothetical protein [Gemmatimonadaceae bacterium]
MRVTGAAHGIREAIDRMRDAARLAVWLSASALLSVSLTSSAGAQVMRYGVVMDAARNALAAEWTDNPTQVERAYCVTQWWTATSRNARVHASPSNDSAAVQKPDGRDADTVFRVLEIKPVETSEATPNGATFACPAGVPEVHTHPPATCYSDRADQCYAGGADAYSCQPSREDARKLLDRGDAFAIIQCDRHAFVFYYPSQFAAPTPPRQDLAEVAKP